MAAITLRRESAPWQDRMRSYTVLIDGQEQGGIDNGAERTIAVPPGPHAVQLKVDWCRSPVLDVLVTPDETKSLVCGPNSTPLLALFHVLFRRNDYIWLRAEEPSGP